MKSLRVNFAFLGVLLGVFAFTGIASAASLGTVPSAGCVGPYNGVFFCDEDLQSAGTGVIDPFLRVNSDGAQFDGTPDTYSSGWNTDATANEVNDPDNDFDFSQSTSLAVGDVGYCLEADSATDPCTADGQYALFTVDINQRGKEGTNADLISLNHFELFSCTTNNYTALSSCTSFFDLFGATETWVNFDFRNHPGSGAGDIDVYIPAALIPATGFIALLDGWGCGADFLACPSGTQSYEDGLYADNDGFQEWLRTGAPLGGSGEGGSGGPGVPEPATLLLLGTGLGLAATTARRRNKKSQTT